ncbi:nucleoside/nucleotide kinase family protein [Methyloprofundus sedimenti]|uniref:hypothetical protein n=1 Tax=Methyloprofundus sedimenti TaxID=1420851 RepID=UPI0018E93397|nr:hypothetical protein [Methyloprofundus sedimenti]
MDNQISNLFLERSQFVLIGLTGRTGSGCTTAANILESDPPQFPEYKDATYNGINFYSGLSQKRYDIVKSYAENNWNKFYSIKVSDLISVYLLTLNSEEILEFIWRSYKGSDNSITEEKIREKLETGIFNQNKITEEFTFCRDYLLNHEKKENPNKDQLEHCISYFKAIKTFTKEFKDDLRSLCNDLYISTYQAAGVSIRKLGRVDTNYDTLEFSPKKVFHLPETINRIVKIIRAFKKNKAFIVIDAIRNPYEAQFFKDRYSAFYLVSINATTKDKNEYLKNT